MVLKQPEILLKNAEISIPNSPALSTFDSFLKRFVDITGAVSGLIILSPFMMFVALRTKLSSKGTIFFLQERIGLNGKKFMICKFRSMYMDAEKNGPLLSGDNDGRITNWGRVMRKWRIDELPQLWNILKGDMTFVGPRAERQYYIDQLRMYNINFDHLLTIKPGLTSLGMVKFGYASTIEEIAKRTRFDVLYLKKISLLLDLKVMGCTLKIILAGKGK